jgi:hypothetical protein
MFEENIKMGKNVMVAEPMFMHKYIATCDSRPVTSNQLPLASKIQHRPSNYIPIIKTTT